MALHKTYYQSYDVVFKKCELALEHLGVDIEYSDKTKGCIQASVSGSLLSWGEDIEVTVQAIGQKETKVIISSEAKAQMISWGRNDTNERRFIEHLDISLR